MKRNALCDGVHNASQTGGRERLGQPGAGKQMFNLNGKQNGPIQIVLSPDDLEEAIRTLVSEMLDEKQMKCFILYECHRQKPNAQKKKAKSRKPDAIHYLKSILAATSFICGIIVAFSCLFFIRPIGGISNSALRVVSELLIICGSILGIGIKNNRMMKNKHKKINRNRKE